MSVVCREHQSFLHFPLTYNLYKHIPTNCSYSPCIITVHFSFYRKINMEEMKNRMVNFIIIINFIIEEKNKGLEKTKYSERE